MSNHKIGWKCMGPLSSDTGQQAVQTAISEETHETSSILYLFQITSGTKCQWRSEFSPVLLCWKWNLCYMMPTCNKSSMEKEKENLWSSNSRQKREAKRAPKNLLLGRRAKHMQTLLPTPWTPLKQQQQQQNKSSRYNKSRQGQNLEVEFYQLNLTKVWLFSRSNANLGICSRHYREEQAIDNKVILFRWVGQCSIQQIQYRIKFIIHTNEQEIYPVNDKIEPNPNMV